MQVCGDGGVCYYDVEGQQYFGYKVVDLFQGQEVQLFEEFVQQQIFFCFLQKEM